jgi:hypothetical protein
MEAYLEAIDIGVYKTTTQGFPQPRDATNLLGDEINYEKWNAKAKNTIFRGLSKDVFNRVRNHKNAHDLWLEICALHEGTKSRAGQKTRNPNPEYPNPKYPKPEFCLGISCSNFKTPNLFRVIRVSQSGTEIPKLSELLCVMYSCHA